MLHVDAASQGVVVTWGDPAGPTESAARRLGAELKLPCRALTAADRNDHRLCLRVDVDGLELCEAGTRGRGLCIRFDQAPGLERPSRRVTGREPIVRAMGPRKGVTIVDATAGLARDTCLLAWLGYRVVALERSPLLAAMIRDALRRGCSRAEQRLLAALRRITFIEGDSRTLLPTVVADVTPEVIYLDPMYPPKRNTAAPKKEIRLLRRLVGDDPDATELFLRARELPVRRVVVKRHPHAPPPGHEPDVQFKGRTTRFDVYLRNERAKT